jgi:hypothetical protein
MESSSDPNSVMPPSPENLARLTFEKLTGLPRYLAYLAAVCLFFLPVIELYHNFQEERINEDQKAIEITVEQGKNWDSTFSNINRVRLGILASAFHRLLGKGPDGQKELEKLCRTLANENRLYDCSNKQDRALLDELCIDGKKKKPEDIVATSEIDQLSEFRSTLLDSLNTYEEIALLRQHLKETPGGSSTVDDIIDAKFWPNIVMRVDEFRPFITYYNEETYLSKGIKYKAWTVLTDEVDQQSGRFHPRDLPAGYLENLKNIEKGWKVPARADKSLWRKVKIAVQNNFFLTVAVWFALLLFLLIFAIGLQDYLSQRRAKRMSQANIKAVEESTSAK